MRRRSRARPSSTAAAARARRKATRAGLALRRPAQRTKRGWAWPRRVASATRKAGSSAEGCVVCCAARRHASRSPAASARSRRGDDGER